MQQKNKYLYTPKLIQKTGYNIVMTYPGIESFALSSLGYMWLTKIVDELDDVNVYSLYSDSSDSLQLPSKINAVSFSVSFEMDIITILEMLEKYNIPVFSKDRENIYVFAGGPVITSNPEPLADFFDFFLIGDGEALLPKVVNFLKQNKDKPKSEVLRRLTDFEGVYVPALKNTVIKITEKLPTPVYTTVLSENAYFSNTFIIEVERGCYNRCGFCLASYLNLPIRFTPYEEITKKIEMGLTYTKNIALLGAQISAHPDFDKICRYVIDKIESGTEINLNFSSLRIDAITPDVVKLLKLSGQKTFTIAIEAANDKLRKVINKNIDENMIYKAVKLASDEGLKGIKFYCMIGLPSENDDDIKDFISIAKKIKSIDKSFDVTFSFSSFIPKPHTPFQWVGREENSSLEKKQKFLSKELSKIGVKSKFSSLKWDYYQTLISRADSSICSYLYEVYKKGGKLGAYKSVAKEMGLNTDNFVTRTFLLDEVLPWDNVVIQKPGKEFLKKEYNRLMNLSSLE